ncbi:MAG: hydrogenase maturation nickel metallochaperone HypA [Pseudomonadota bacterium]
MHELGLSRNIVSIVSEAADGNPVARVKLAIGPLACVETKALQFCWDIVTEDGPLNGATLEIVAAEGDTFLIKEFEFGEMA